jgi:1-phosphofructokinase family hexose kinase
VIAIAGLNSAVDRLVEVETLAPGAVIRAHAAAAWPGGKGVHAAMCVAALGEDVQLAGLIDTAHRESFATWLRARGVRFLPIDIAGPLRTNLAIRERGGRVTEILEPGPPIDPDVAGTAIDRIVEVSRSSGVVVLSGSLPPGMPVDSYRLLVSRLAPVRAIVDASGEVLRHALGARPFCVKPNRDEAELLTGITIDTPAAGARAARLLASAGVALAVISLGERGAVACAGERTWHIVAPQVTPVNTVGAGDCVTAGIAVGLARGADAAEAARLGVAAGTAKVLSPETGVVRAEDIAALLPATRITLLA